MSYNAEKFGSHMQFFFTIFYIRIRLRVFFVIQTKGIIPEW